MEAPQEGQAGENRPLPSGSGSRVQRGAGREGDEPTPREHQAYLPGLENLGPGWTVFGPQEEATSTRGSSEEGETTEETTGEALTPRNGGEGATAAEEPGGAVDEEPGTVSVPGVVPPEGAGAVPDGAFGAGLPVPLPAPAPASSTTQIEPAAPGPGSPTEAGGGGLRRAVSEVRPEPVVRSKGLPVPWAIVLLVALVTAAAGVLAAHLTDKEPVEAHEGSAPPQDVGGEGAADRTEVARLERELAQLREQLREARAAPAVIPTQGADAGDDVGSGAAEAESSSVPAAGPPQDHAPRPVSGSEIEAQRSGRSEEPAAEVPEEPSEAAGLRILRARAFDEVLRALENGRTGQALVLLQGFTEEDVFAPGGGRGFALIDVLVGSWDTLERIDVGGSAGSSPSLAPALTDVRAGLERARGLREVFEVDAGSWLGAGGPPDPTAERLGRLDGLLGELARRLEAATDQAEASHDEDWQWIQGLGVPQDPALVAQHSARFGCDHESTILAATRDALIVSCLWSGEIDAEGLERAQHLAAWGRRVVAKPPSERSSEETDLLWLWYARRWYVEGAEADSFDWRGMELPLVLAPREDWRTELRLAVQLAGPRSGWPTDPGLVAFHRIDGPGPARWRADEIEPVRGEGERWLLSRHHFDETGTPLGGVARVRLERDELRYRYEGSDLVLLDLRAHGKAVAVAPCPLLPDELPPPLEGLGAAEIVSPQVRYGSETGPCLVFRDGEWTRWFAPGFGLVREERAGPDGVVRIDLCALGSAP